MVEGDPPWGLYHAGVSSQGQHWDHLYPFHQGLRTHSAMLWPHRDRTTGVSLPSCRVHTSQWHPSEGLQDRTCGRGTSPSLPCQKAHQGRLRDPNPYVCTKIKGERSTRAWGSHPSQRHKVSTLFLSYCMHCSTGWQMSSLRTRGESPFTDYVTASITIAGT